MKGKWSDKMENFIPKTFCFKTEPPTIVLFYELEKSGRHQIYAILIQTLISLTLAYWQGALSECCRSRPNKDFSQRVVYPASLSSIQHFGRGHCNSTHSKLGCKPYIYVYSFCSKNTACRYAMQYIQYILFIH